MKTSFVPRLGLVVAVMALAQLSQAQSNTAAQTDPAQPPPVMSTPPASADDLVKMYNTSVENRVADILKKLNLSDDAKSNQVHDLLVTQYHALKTRDEAIDAKLKAAGKEINYANRADDLAAQSKPLHDQFLAKLGGILTPDQVETVKDGMTYNKVAFTYTAYCNILPDLTDADKAKIKELLTSARDEAMDGGSAPEKSAIFQKYKDQINDYLNSHGHDVAQATKDWQAKQATAAK
jgi:hypothetical protein